MKSRTTKSTLSQALCLILSLSIALPLTPGKVIAAVVPQSTPNAALREVTSTLAQRYDRIFSRMPARVLRELDSARGEQVARAVSRELVALRESKSNLGAFRESMVKRSRQAALDQKQELFYQIHNLDRGELDAIADRLRGNRHYAAALAEYDSGFTRTEKANALAAMVSKDIDVLTSMMTKRSHSMTSDDWAKDLVKLHGEYQKRGPGQKKWLKTLKWALIGVAAAGLITWGVASGVYSKKLDSRRGELQREFNRLQSDLESQYNSLAQRLDQEEQDFLRTNGFVLATCASYSLPDSWLCNRYAYQLFSGNTYCTVQCMKNVTTGQETLHQAAVCTTPFIPADCYDPSEYDRGYSAGDSDGYYDGYYDGEYDGARDGERNGTNDGYDDGYSSGYNDGYNQGFDDGYAGGKSFDLKSDRATGLSDGRKKGYENGLIDGLMAAKGVLL